MRISLIFALALMIISCNVKQETPDEIKKAILQRIKVPVFPKQDFLITDFGANTGDSLQANQVAFAKVIDACHKAGGGRVVVPSGQYLVNGPIHLKSNVNLHLENKAVIRFGSNPKDYLPLVKTSWEGTFIYNYSPFIYGYKLTNVAITGKGVIDGEASNTWSKWKDIQHNDQFLSRQMNHQSVPVEERIFGEGHYLRPHLIQLYDCQNILVEDIKLEDSPFWCIHLLMCKNASLRRLSYDAQNKNNDGIDPEYSEDILIEDIDFNNSDDNVAIKAGRDHEGRSMKNGSKNIIIRNCRLKGLHGIVIGSEMSAGVHHVFVENCKASGYLKRGLYIKSNPDRGGEISHIYFKNIRLDEVEDCFFITSFYHSEGEGFESYIHNIYIDSVYCRKASANGIVIQGFPSKKVKNIYFNDVTISSAKNAISMQETENIVFSNLNIGVVAEAPSHVQ